MLQLYKMSQILSLKTFMLHYDIILGTLCPPTLVGPSHDAVREIHSSSKFCVRLQFMFISSEFDKLTNSKVEYKLSLNDLKYFKFCFPKFYFHEKFINMLCFPLFLLNLILQ